jgi:excisionase family DNA binding protein
LDTALLPVIIVGMSLLSPTQAAAILGVKASTVRDYARSGLVPARKIGKHWRFVEADLYRVGKINTCSIDVPAVRISGFGSDFVDAKLDAALARVTAPKPNDSKRSSEKTPGRKRS